MPRSGTTLVSTILSRHSQISIAPETHFIAHDWRINQHINLNKDRELYKFWQAFVSGKWFKDLQLKEDELYASLVKQKPRSFQVIFCKILKEYAAKHEKSRWGEKTPGHYHHIDTLLEWYPNANIIFVVRDPRAVVASLLQTPWSNKYTSFHVLRWKACFQIMKSWSADKRVRVLKYEDLVTSPEKTVRQLFEYLDEPFEERALVNESAVFALTRDDWGNRHLKSAQSEISESSLNGWQSKLTSYQQDVVEMVNLQEMKEMGYEPQKNIFSLMTKIRSKLERVISRLHLGLARRFAIKNQGINKI